MNKLIILGVIFVVGLVSISTTLAYITRASPPEKPSDKGSEETKTSDGSGVMQTNSNVLDLGESFLLS